MTELNEILPFVIPLAILQLGLLAYTLFHIFTHKRYKRGNRLIWTVVSIVGMQFIGPILYFVLGKEDN